MTRVRRHVNLAPIRHFKRVISFSGGIGSWAAAKRVVAQYGIDDVVLLFADTLMEDRDTYRFLRAAAANIGVPLTRIADGRTPWQLFHESKYLGNSRVDLCSRVLKRDLLRKWFRDHCTPNSIWYLGIDWSEIERLHRVRRQAPKMLWEAPMCSKPYMSKEDMIQWGISEGLPRQRLYDMNFPHANCGGFCIKAGVGHFLNLLKRMPKRFRFHENNEQLFIKNNGNVSILREQRNGKKKHRLTLKRLREREESGDAKLDREEWGGCGCAIN